MLALTMRTMPSAVSRRPRPSVSASGAMAASAETRVEAHAAADQLRGQAAEHEVGVRDGGSRAAPAVAGRPRHGAGAHGTDAHQAVASDVRDRPAAGPDGVDVDRGEAHRKAGDAAAERHLRLAVADEADVGGGAAHVEGDEIAAADRAPAATAPTTPAAGPDSAVRIGISPARADRHQPARGLADADAGTRRMALDGSLQARHVAAGDRLQEGVEHGGGEPLVLAELRLHLAGERDVTPGSAARSASTDADLVLGIEEREQEADRHALGPAGLHVGDGALDVRLRQRPDDLARRPDALGDLEAMLARNQRLGVVGLEIVDLGTRLAADLEQVLEACRGDERDLAAAPLDQRVGGDRRAVGEEGEAIAGRRARAALRGWRARDHRAWRRPCACASRPSPHPPGRSR